MFDGIKAGQTVTLRVAGSTQGLAMRAVYNGETDGIHALSGTGVMSAAKFGAVATPNGWALTNGRRLLSVEV